MKKGIFLFIGVMSMFTINAQNINVDIATERNLMSKNVSNKVNADGSPYINDNFASIRITQYKDRLFNARYNAYNGEMEVRIEDNKVIALDNNSDYEVIFTSDNKTYRTVNYVTDQDYAKKGFLVVISENDKYSLFKEEKIKFLQKVKATTSYQQDKPAKFQREDDRFYLKINDETTYVPQKKKDLLEAFPEHAKDLKSYMKKNKLNPKNEDELIKIVEYLSTLSE